MTPKRALPKVTVMIPTYNQSRFIERAVGSALEQSYANLEVVVGDDASTDETEQIISAIEDPRLIYQRHPSNLGRTGNYRQLLYEFASGDYVVNLDGDDYFTDQDFVTEAVKLLMQFETPPLLVVANATTLSDTAEFIPPFPSHNLLDGLNLLKKLPKPEYGLTHMAVLYSAVEARNIDFYRSSALSSDWESLYRLCAKGTVAYLHRNIGVWRQHENNQTADIDDESALLNLGIWHSIYQNARAMGMSAPLATLKRYHCESYFALRFIVLASRNDNAALLRLVAKLVLTYPAGMLFLFCNPRSVARIGRSLCGFDRSTAPSSA